MTIRRKQFLIIGLGRFGSGVANTLYGLGHEVVAIDSNEEPVQQNMNRVTHAVIADATDQATLRDIGVDHFDAVIVDIGANVEANIYATLAAKDAGARHIVCKAVDVISKRILEKIGADKVIRPEFDSGVELAYALASPKLLGQIDLTNDIIVIELEVSDGLNGSLERLGFAKLGIQVIAHARGQTVRTVINADTEIKRGDKLVRLGRNASLEKLRESVATVRMNERGAGWPSRAIGLPNVPLRSAARIWYSSNVNESALEQSQNCSALEKASSEIAVQCIKSKR